MGSALKPLGSGASYGRRRRSRVQFHQDMLDLLLIAGEHHLDGPVAAIAYPTVEAERLRFIDHEGTKSDPLHPSADDHVDGPAHQNVAPICQGTNSLSP